MAAQPCLMALEADSANDVAAMTADAHGNEHCPHCPPEEMPNSSGDDLCSFVDAYDYDARTPGSDSKLKTQSADAMTVDWAVVLAAPSGLARLSLAAAADEPHHHPPPFLDFCRFIE